MIGILRRRASPLEKKIGYRFRNARLLSTALVHPSYRFEMPGEKTDYQRMEFLGDAVLGFVVAAHIYDRFSDQEEGYLTSLRSRITSGKALAEMGRAVGLGERIKIGKGEELSGGRQRPSNLADALEAVIGAAYLDGGMRAVEKIFKTIFVPELNRGTHDFWDENPKGRLQDMAQRIHRRGPTYRVAKEEGPSHEKIFTVHVMVGGTVMGVGTGRNKRDAEAQAAAEAIKTMEQQASQPSR
jgi:ribonuclease III